MKDDILKDILEDFKILTDTFIEFKTLYGFTFVFETKIITMQEKVSSAEIRPVGIIYEENGQYYLAPLDEAIDIEAIVKEYVDECLR